MRPRRGQPVCCPPVNARLSRIVVAVLALALVGSLAACGNKQDVVTEAATEGIFVDVGGLAYQVQISRALNPASAEDRDYLVGLPATVPPPKPDETWFAVFLRVENNEGDGSRPVQASTDLKIVDTVGQTYQPVTLDPTNVFAYTGATLGPGDVLPAPDTAASEGPVQGSLVLFKLPVQSFQDRPLQLRIADPQNAAAEATIDLDV